MDPTSNYTGMFLSDGHFQESVMFGKTKPKNQVDAESRLHDTAYAYWKGSSNRKYRRAADKLYQDRMPSTIYGQTAGALVHYGNHLINAVSGIAQPWNGYQGVFDELFGADDLMYQQAVINLYDTDPTANHVNYTPNITSTKTETPFVQPDTGGAQSGDYTVIPPSNPGAGTSTNLPTSLNPQPKAPATYNAPKLGDPTMFGLTLIPTETKLPNLSDAKYHVTPAFR